MSTTRDRAPLAAASRILGIALVGLVITGCAAQSTSPSSAPTSAVVPSPTPAVTPTIAPTPSATASPLPSASAIPTGSLEPADLTGVLVAPALAHRSTLAVMIDDQAKARPQSGFNAASVVYQATADGYESRYMLVFQDGETTAVGPVRSARMFLVQWAQETGAALSHYGGDRRTRSYLRWHIRPSTNVDGLGRGNPAYHRIKTRKAPHNAYTSTKDLRRMALKLGAPARMPASLFRRPFRDPVPLAERGTAQHVRVPYHTNVITYDYDRDRDLYLRSVDGKPHIDPADGQRVTTTNIVVLFQRFRIDTKIERGHARPDIKTIGQGRALVLMEGKQVKGTWRKRSDTAPTRIYDANGKEIALVRGRTFFQVVPIGTKVKVTD